MTIRIEVTNPAEHQPQELRTVALCLSSLADDIEQGCIKYTPAFRSLGAAAVASHEVPAQTPPVETGTATSAAPGASATSEPNTSADAGDACDTSQADSAGVMWDERIHAETKTQNKDGTWRNRRNVDKALIEQVVAEQRAAAAGDTTDDDAPPPPVDEEEKAPDVPDEPKGDAPPVETVKPADVIKFSTANKLDAATVQAIAESFGLKNAAGVFTKPEVAADFLVALQSLVG